VQYPEYVHPNHRQAIDRLTAQFVADPNYDALIIGGSVAKGLAQPTSDVDVLLVATAAEYARKAGKHEFWYWAGQELAGYEGGYFDGKIVDLQFLRDVADHGSETARSAFVGAFVAFSRIPGLESLLAAIPVYPEQEREAKIKAFAAQLLIGSWYAGEAEKRQDRYLMLRTASDMVLYGSRMILAYNRILFPYHKWLLQRVGEAPEKPANLLEKTHALLEHPCEETTMAYKECIMRWRDWGVPWSDAVVRFMIDTEWNWRQQRAPLGDW
jgi:hypothetical protein